MTRLVETRTAKLYDDNTFETLFHHPGSVYLLTRGLIRGRPTVVAASDPEPPEQPPDLLGSLEWLGQALDLAEAESCPVVFLFDAPDMFKSGRTAFQGSGVDLMLSPHGIGRLYHRLGRLTDRVPILGGVFGHMAQAQAFPAAMCQATVMLEDASVSIGRPDAVMAMLGEKTDYQNMGGARMHSRTTGLCDHVAQTEADALDWLRRVLGYLPAGPNQAPPSGPPGKVDPTAAPLAEVIPEQLNKPFGADRALAALVDAGSFIELEERYGREAVTGLARINGRPFAVAANNPLVRGGVLFPETIDKLIHFIELADRFNLPLVFLADAPGFMIGQAVEHAGIVRAGASLFRAIARTTTPRLSVVLRRAYTAGLYAMSGSGFQPDRLFALPGASISVYGPEAVERFLTGLDLPEERKESLRRHMEEEHDLNRLLEQGYLDGILPPERVRDEIDGFLSRVSRAVREEESIENRD